MRNVLSRFAKNESGATAIEYGLIAAIMAVAVIAAFNTLGDGLGTSFGNLSDALATAPTTLE